MPAQIIITDNNIEAKETSREIELLPLSQKDFQKYIPGKRIAPCKLKLRIRCTQSTELLLVFRALRDQKIALLVELCAGVNLVLQTACSGNKNAAHYLVTAFKLEENSELVLKSANCWKTAKATDYYYFWLSNAKLILQSRSYIWQAEHTEHYYLYLDHSFAQLRFSEVCIAGKAKISAKYLLKDKVSLQANAKLAAFKANIRNYSLVLAEGKENRAFTSCEEILLGKAKILTVPALRSADPSNELHHEARIGKIKKEELQYLLARGYSPAAAARLLLLRAAKF
ncbi:MAG: hypothetical protein GXO42_01525 [bacterium]|nr:hypothetical protein [bacterium]